MKFEVIIVDDDKIITLVHKRMILKCNFHTDPLSFSNGKEALEYILENDESEKTCCILLDINMPVLNGWEFLEAINQQKIEASLLVFLITSSVDNADKQKAKNYPQVVGFLEKPISLGVLQELKKNERLKMFFDENK